MRTFRFVVLCRTAVPGCGGPQTAGDVPARPGRLRRVPAADPALRPAGRLRPKARARRLATDGSQSNLT